MVGSCLSEVCSYICIEPTLQPITGEILNALQKHLGYFNHTFRLSQLHQCDQGMLPNTFSRKFIEELLF